jgi:NADH-quinone oxidoreductase subunit M
MHTSLWLSLLLVFPLVGAALIIGLRASDQLARVIGISAAALELVLTIVVALAYRASHAIGSGSATTVFDFTYRKVLAPSLGVAYDVGLDGISLFLVALTALVILLALVGANESRRTPAFVAWLLVLMTATIGAFATRDMLSFFLFFELTLIPSYFLIAGWGGSQRAAAALKFFVYTLFGSGFLLVGMVYIAVRHQHVFGGDLTFAMSALKQTPLSSGVATWIMIGFLIAFGIKSPIFPLHTWSPLAYAEAPIAGSMVLSALLAKLGTYGLLRFAVGLLPQSLNNVRPIVLTLAVIGILYGSGLAAVSKELKRVVAYSSMAQVGFIVLGIFAGSQIATSGAVLLMFNHGVITAGLFLLIGGIERRRGTSTISALSGLQGPAPVLAALFTVVMLASIGLPGLSGFVSELLVLLGSFNAHPWWAAIATTGVIFAALYLLWAYQRVFHGEATGENAVIEDATTKERWVLAPIIVLVVVLGIYPAPLLNKINPSTHAIVAHSTSQGVNR